MKTGFATMLFFLAGTACLHAQTAKRYNVAPGERVSTALHKANGLYLYPQFSDAQVALKNGTSGVVRMNYNRLLGAMQFLNEKGDTLLLDNNAEVASIFFGKDTFVYSDGYVQLLEGTGGRMAQRKGLQLTNRRAVGGMGEQNAGSTTTYTGVYATGLKDLVPNEALTFSEVTTYFIGDRFNRFKPLNKKSLHNFYGKKEKEIDAYLQANPVNFSQEEDVRRLIDFLKTL